MINASCIVMSDRASSGTYLDASGPAVAEFVGAQNDSEMGPIAVIADSTSALQSTLRLHISGPTNVVVVAGGTGIGRRDISVQAVRSMARAELYGIGEAMRSASLADGVGTALLSQGTGFVVDDALVVCIPGNPKAVPVCLSAVWPTFGHAVELLRAPSSADPHSAP